MKISQVKSQKIKDHGGAIKIILKLINKLALIIIDS